MPLYEYSCHQCSRKMAEITPGRYRHYKGKEYTVLGVARHEVSSASDAHSTIALGR